ncbi:MAG TPA: 16S rRNA (cytosine(1402)-N(4))-methyltransferase RsmH [Terriglobia bacterium]|nr:16S rRNA (cytosine(1402)-N(4))-methyltransferase RsmH [Terriglobia bacterium]
MSTEKPKRRPRYKGKNPRHFSEKYKEHDAERYAADVDKVIQSGKTPAGMHRPVMVGEVMEVLDPQPGELAIDCTLGYGGHAAALLQALQPGGRLIALDVDPIELPKAEARLRALGFGPEALTVHRTNFAGLAKGLPEPADIILADLGLSSMQMDNPKRGFTYKYDGPLDLRMNPQRGQAARALLETLDETALAALLLANADEPKADRLARAIKKTSVSTTTQLTAIVRSAGGDEDSVRRVFQALRIAVNDEFGALDAFLQNLPFCLKTGGRVAILTFHSGEDRRVKKSFQAGERSGVYSEVAQEVRRPASSEIRANPRSRSAKLRWARRA